MIVSSLAVLFIAAQDPAPPAPPVPPVAPEAATADLFPNIEMPQLQPGDQAVLLMGCLAHSTGELKDCRVLAENPANSGLAETAVQGAMRGRLSPRASSSIREPVPVRFNMRFRTSDDGSASTE